MAAITKRDDGRYFARIPYVEPETGRKKRKAVYGRTKKECQRKIDQFIGKRDAGEISASEADQITLSVWLRLWYDQNAGGWKPQTQSMHDRSVRRIEAAVAERRLRDPAINEVSVAYVGDLLNVMAKQGVKPRSLEQVHQTCNTAMNAAISQELISRNAFAIRKPPKSSAEEKPVIDTELTRRIIDEARLLHLGEGLIVLCTTGMRSGELLGLQWADIDFRKRAISIRRTLTRTKEGALVTNAPKTRAGLRTIEVAKVTLDALRDHLNACKEEGIPCGDKDFVMGTSVGSPVGPFNFARDVWRPIKRKLAGELPGNFSIHCLRHSYVTNAIDNGVPLATVSALVGHANPGITVKMYSHRTRAGGQVAASHSDKMYG